MIRSRAVGLLVWLAVLPVAAWAVVRTAGWTPAWQWVPLVAFTPYVAALSVVTLLLAAVSRRRASAAVALAASVALIAAVLPRYVADGGPAAGPSRLRVLAANLRVGSGDTASLMRLVRDLRPDVLALQELTPAALGRLDEAGLRGLMPYVVDRSRPGVSGSGIYSRHPLTEAPLIELGRFRQSRAVVALPGGREVEVVSVHPCAPSQTGKVPCWGAGLAALPRAGGRPRVLAGDFNATLDHPPVRDLLASGYRDAADATGRGLTPTWPRLGWRSLPGVTIDHVLADRRMPVSAFSVHSLPGSDHRPVFAELGLP